MLYESKPITDLENFKASFPFHSFPSGLYIHFAALLWAPFVKCVPDYVSAACGGF